MPNGNVVEGEYTQKEKEDTGSGTPRSGAGPTKEFEINWNPNMGIAESSTKINNVPE